MLTFIPVPIELFLVYVEAARMLRSALGPAAPDVTGLLTQEFRNRRSMTIAEEYLELNGHPTLRACRRAMAKNHNAAGKSGTRSRLRSGRSLSRTVTQGDPTRN